MFKNKNKVKEKPMVTRKRIVPLVLALANNIMDKLGLVEKINELVEWDKDHWNVSPGNLAKTLILSTFTDIRIPLTHIQERFEQVDLECLLGPIEGEHSVNPSNIGRALDRISEIDYEGLYETTALNALQTNNIPTNCSHSDTTTISFYGEYDIDMTKLTEEEKEELLKIEKGYNKDGRPGCNQAIIGQIVGDHGIPLTSRILDGSASDVMWNRLALNYLDEIQEKGFTSGIYVADSKLVTEELITRMNNPDKRIEFVSRCPANFYGKLESRVITMAYKASQWEDLGQLGAGKNASCYKGKSYIETVYGQPMRLLVLESSALAANAKSAAEKEKEGLVRLIRETEKKKFMCKADAEKEYEMFDKAKATKLFNCEYEIIKDIKEKWPRGRRSEKTRPDIEETWQIHITEVNYDADAYAKFIQNESCIVIISNVLENTTNEELLRIYKGQQTVENSFRMLKGPHLASVIYLKNPARIKVLSMLLSISLLIRAIIQYRMREGLKKHNQDNPNEIIYAGWGGRPLKNPTFKLFYEHSARCYYEREAPGQYSFAWPNVETKHVVLPLLTLMGVTIFDILE